ncbi:MAG: hypothetical protein NT008_07950 [Methylococcales bacterium]|nr:hypothetical protein [Methylococcales bacterium]
MVNYAFDLAIWTALFFIMGMYKPQWPLFFMKKPERFLILIITTVLVMITFTLYGEGNRRAKIELTNQHPTTQESASSPVPVPTPKSH